MLNQKGFAVLDLQRLLEGIRNNWLIFTGSLVLFMAVAYLYIKFATPLYQVGLSMLIDTSGKSRKLGESMIVGGDVGLIETEKNLFNEIAVIKSYQLIERTVSELNFDVTYHTQQGLEDVEHFSYFPFKVKLLESHQHLYGIPFYVELLPERRYRLEVNAKDFVIYNSETRMNFMVEESLEISNIYSFGVNVKHDYFHFVLEEPDFEVNADHFSDDRIYFKIHSTDAVTKSYLNRIDVTQAGLDASIIELKSTGPVVKKEAEFLERLCQNYIDSKLERRDEIASSKEYFIEKQLAAVADSLARAERTLEAFKRRSNAVNLSQVATNALTQVQRLQTEEAKLQLNLKYYNSQLENLNLHDHEMLTAPSVVGIEDAMLNENLLELKRLYANRTRENLIRGEQSLDIEIIDNQIENSTRSLERTLRNLVESTNMSINDLRTRIGSMDSFISELPQSQKRLLSIERKRTLY
ncbi:MAG: Wzz/FepE/Etk N-terminal domain-containing protein, partial [Saprospiraceae bacterium]|nr:Wzz/FepE/Etk N-terminal domain-containing protein [Saprospiraceae bacterium]